MKKRRTGNRADIRLNRNQNEIYCFKYSIYFLRLCYKCTCITSCMSSEITSNLFYSKTGKVQSLLNNTCGSQGDTGNFGAGLSIISAYLVMECNWEYMYKQLSNQPRVSDYTINGEHNLYSTKPLRCFLL